MYALEICSHILELAAEFLFLPLLDFAGLPVASVVFFLLLQPLEAVKNSSSEDHHDGSVVCVDESIPGNSWGAAGELGLWTFLGTALQVRPHTTSRLLDWF